MRTTKDVIRRLTELGVQNKFVIWPEISELPKILFEDEVIEQCIIGGHPTGFCCLLATNRRVILIDKVYFGLVVEDAPYNNIQAVHFNYGLFFGEVTIQLFDKTISMRRIFRSSIQPFVRFAQDQVQQAAQQAIHVQRQALTVERSALPGRQQARLHAQQFAGTRHDRKTGLRALGSRAIERR